MGIKTYKSEGIVLKRTNFGEADKIVTVYSRHYGKATLLAKGIRRMTSRKRSSLEVFNQVSFFAVKGRGMDIITETELINSFCLIRKDLQKIAVAYQLCEMVDKLTAENSEQEEVYELLTENLKLLNSSTEKNKNGSLGAFGLKLLIILGYWPEEKKLPKNFHVSEFIEEIIEKDLKAKKFLNKI